MPTGARRTFSRGGKWGRRKSQQGPGAALWWGYGSEASETDIFSEWYIKTSSTEVSDNVCSKKNTFQHFQGASVPLAHACGRPYLRLNRAPPEAIGEMDLGQTLISSTAVAALYNVTQAIDTGAQYNTMVYCARQRCPSIDRDPDSQPDPALRPFDVVMILVRKANDRPASAAAISLSGPWPAYGI